MIDIVFADGDVLVALVIDASPEQRHRISTTPTEVEVERGVDITDHVRRNRDPLSLDVVISDTPLFLLEGIENRARDAWAQLEDAADRSLLAIVTTDIATYEDMVLTEALTTKTAADGSWIRAALTFTPIRQVSTELVDDPVPARARDRRQVDRGAQATEPATAREERLASAAVQLFG